MEQYLQSENHIDYRKIIESGRSFETEFKRIVTPDQKTFRPATIYSHPFVTF